MRFHPLPRFNRTVLRASLAAAAFGLAATAGVLAACSGSSGGDNTLGGGDSGSVDSSAVSSDSGTGTGNDGGTTTDTVTFSYSPGWSGATKVEVVGGFNQPSTDWSTTASFLTLTGDGSGNFTGTAQLPAGTYIYLFRVTGDDAAGDAGAYSRYAIDPTNTAFTACPTTSPTYDKNNPNPCSQLTVAQPAPTTMFHVSGTLTVDGNPAPGWLVVIERNETGSHHFFANRVTTGSDGKYSLAASQGSYRLQAQYPTYMSQNDAKRDPITDQALRRAISGTKVLTADLTVEGHEVAFHDYASFSPVNTGDSGVALPQVFTFGAGTTPPERLAIYGGPAEIGDPYYESAAVTTGQSSFDGNFTTKQAVTDAAVPGKGYFWGIERATSPEAGVPWTDESMVFAVEFE